MYDVIVIGCGPAGMTSAIYAARANKKVLILEKDSIGGQIASSPLVENYPGYTKISGSELTNNMFVPNSFSSNVTLSVKKNSAAHIELKNLKKKNSKIKYKFY